MSLIEINMNNHFSLTFTLISTYCQFVCFSRFLCDLLLLKVFLCDRFNENIIRDCHEKKKINNKEAKNREK